ncbi:RrF2 family transcriptional regulator [Acinetobacter calcoaceticus]|uniref:RrF2 family transcriptional regulator n=1 Tax=Acinetobacter calcoaceticus TaxID=471 RepID=UPI0009E3D96C
MQRLLLNGFCKYSIFHRCSCTCGNCTSRRCLHVGSSRRYGECEPGFVKRILVKLSKAKLVKSTVGKSGGYGLAKSPNSISLLDIYSAVDAPDAFAIHTYPKRNECIISCNIKEVMGEVLASTQEAVRRDLVQTSLSDVVSKIRARSN